MKSVKNAVFILLIAVTLFHMSISLQSADAAVLVTDSELALAKKHITEEPLRSYLTKLAANQNTDAAPILYLLTGDNRYAELSRKHVLDDLEYLREYIPYMVDIWILKSPGRAVSAIMAYDMTRESGLYTDEDMKNIRETLGWTIEHYLNRGKDHLGKGFIYQTDYIPEDMDDWVIANMNVHRLLAAGLFGLVFSDDPRSKDITAYTENYYERILSLGSRPGGAWAENPRYMGGVLQELYMLASALKNTGKRDFFTDERLRVMFGFFAESIPAPCIEHPARPLMVAADDAHWWENRSTILSWAAARYADKEPRAAGEWMWCWNNQGSPLTPESLLFVNPEIAEQKPAYTSYLPGMGYAVLRDRFGAPDETFFFTTFGPEYGTANKTMHHAPGHGDFSIIWRGHPLFLTRGCASYVWSRRMRDQTDFLRSVVTYDGAGSSIEIPERRFSGPANEVNTTVDESLFTDYFSDGITHFVSGATFDYVSGECRDWDMSLPASFSQRHFLFLKPDVFLVWDQVRSSYPLQWNLHMPADNVRQNGNSIQIDTPDGVSLTLDFLQDEPLDFTLDWPLESIRAEWPLVLSLDWGKGKFIFNDLDIARQIIDHDQPGARKIFENLMSYPSRPKTIGLIETDGQTAQVLDKLGFAYELLDYDDLAGDLSRFDRIVVGHFAVLVRDRDMFDYREKLWKYVENGGVCYWAYQYAWGWKPGDTSGPGYFPKTLMVGEGTSVVWGEGIELDRPVTTDGGAVWKAPNAIAQSDWDGWHVGQPDTFKVMPLYPILTNTDRARNIPVYYSDYWTVHASALKTYNITPPQTRSRFGPYRWLKIHHAPSDDYLCVLRPSEKGKPSASILKRAENEAVIEENGYVWWFLSGTHTGINATMTLFGFNSGRLSYTTDEKGGKTIFPQERLGVEPDEILLVDAMSAEIGGKRYSFDTPATFHLNRADGTGKIAVQDECTAVLPWKLDRATVNGKRLRIRADNNGSTITIPAGEYTFTFRDTQLDMTKTTNIAHISVSGTNGSPVQWVHVSSVLDKSGRTQFQGATDKNGSLVIRWQGGESQDIILKKDNSTIKQIIRPGKQKIVFQE